MLPICCFQHAAWRPEIQYALLQMEPLYRDLTSGTEMVESQLGESLAEYLNAEIALRNITDLQGARRWLSGTFLFVRMSLHWAAVIY